MKYYETGIKHYEGPQKDPREFFFHHIIFPSVDHSRIELSVANKLTGAPCIWEFILN
jgi:hypothetical protein